VQKQAADGAVDRDCPSLPFEFNLV
jgi:hypothetical protein